MLYSDFLLLSVQIFLMQKISIATFRLSTDDIFDTPLLVFNTVLGSFVRQSSIQRREYVV